MGLFRRLFSQSDDKDDPVASTKDLISPEQEDDISKALTDTLSADYHDEAETVPVGNPDMDTRPQNMDLSMVNEIAEDDGKTRPLAIETIVSTRNDHLIFGQSTDVGMVRTNNQDAVLSFYFTSRSSEERPDFGLFLVADGMGGHHDGEKASSETIQTVATEVTQNIYLPIISNEFNEKHNTSITEMLISAVQKANQQVIAHIPDGGTTLSGVMVIRDLAYIVHVGDSRIYIVTKDGIEQVTRDHSLVQRLIELDQLTYEEALEHPQKNVLYRALGQNESLEVDAITRRLPPASRILICSDGLWNLVQDEDICEIVMNNDNPQVACDKLVALANTRGGTDNITTVLLHVPST
jgi:serine/threonine protein phosphatase PrpC